MGDVPTRDEAREAYEAGMAVAVAMTRSKELARELVQVAFERILTTRPWVRAKHTFAVHAANTVRSLVLHARMSKAASLDKTAHEGFYAEEVGHASPSAQDTLFSRAEEEGRQADADQELDALDAALGDNVVARDVLRCRREHGLVKAREIADKIGSPVEQVYRANETLRERLRALREKQGRAVRDEQA